MGGEATRQTRQSPRNAELFINRILQPYHGKTVQVDLSRQGAECVACLLFTLECTRSLLKKSFFKKDFLRKWAVASVKWPFLHAFSRNIAIFWLKVGR
jgi:hypothetical protein